MLLVSHYADNFAAKPLYKYNEKNNLNYRCKQWYRERNR